MLTSPISVTIGGTAHSLSRINQDNYSSVFFKKGTGYEIKMTIRHAYEGKSGVLQTERHVADLEYTTFDTDGKATLTQTYQHIRNVRGTEGTLAVDLAKALDVFVTANAAALVAWES